MAAQNIRVTIISPGAVATELPDSVADPVAGERVRKIYAEVAIPADCFARAVAFAIAQPERWTSTRSCSARPGRNSEDRRPGA